MATPLAFGLMPWEAVATFFGAVATIVAGVTAVVAAYRIGIMQLAILKHQTLILHRQAETDESRLRAELFERRLKVYLIIRDTIHDVVQNDAALNKARVGAVFESLDECRFIFSDEIFDFGASLVNRLGELIEFRDSLGKAQQTKDVNLIREAETGARETCAKLTVMRDSMHDMFRTEIHLSSFKTDIRLTGSDDQGAGEGARNLTEQQRVRWLI